MQRGASRRRAHVTAPAHEMLLKCSSLCGACPVVHLSEPVADVVCARARSAHVRRVAAAYGVAYLTSEDPRSTLPRHLEALCRGFQRYNYGALAHHCRCNDSVPGGVGVDRVAQRDEHVMGIAAAGQSVRLDDTTTHSTKIWLSQMQWRRVFHSVD